MNEGFDAASFLCDPRWSSVNLGLERVSMLMHYLGDPQDGLDLIHVAGTNGKGSVCCFLASIFKESGLTVGQFSSPYIESISESIQVNGQRIAGDAFSEIALKIQNAAVSVEECLGEHPSSFEMTCAAAFAYFAQMECDIAVIEVGLGGLFDATNIIEPKACVITSIALDHVDLIGPTLQDIAFEKAGIIKRGVPVVLLKQEDCVMDIVKGIAAKQDAEISLVDPSDIRDIAFNGSMSGLSFKYKDESFCIRSLARYQSVNAALSIEAAKLFMDRLHVSESDIEKGICNASWPARFEVYKGPPYIVLDGAHNAQGASALRESLGEVFALPGQDDTRHADEHGRRPGCERRLQVDQGDITCVLGVLADKDYASIIDALSDIACRWVIYEADNTRAMDVCSLEAAIGERGRASSSAKAHTEIIPCSSAEDAIEAALDKTSPEGLIVAFGTLYSTSAIKRRIHALLQGRQIQSD